MIALSKASLVISRVRYGQMMEAQRMLAPQFFAPEVLAAADKWIANPSRKGEGDVYLLGEQQLLLAMMESILAGGGTRRRTFRAPGDLHAVGRALLHVVNELDPLQNTRSEVAALAPDEAKRRFAEFVLRKGLFYGHEDYRYAVTRYHHMVVNLAPAMQAEPDAVDALAIFRRATGLSLPTYLSMGLYLLVMFQLGDIQEIEQKPVVLDRRRFFRRSAVSAAAPRFFKVIAAPISRFRQAARRDRDLFGYEFQNFLEAERHPLLEIRRGRLVCLSARFLERKFSSGLHHVLLSAMTDAEKERYFSFFGRVFERYVQELAGRTFPGGRFVPGFKYGKPEKEAADGWVLYPRAGVIIDAKSTRFTVPTRLGGEFGSFERTFRDSILKAARQLSRVIDDLRSEQFRVGSLGPIDLPALYPLIVTIDYVPLDHFLSTYVHDVIASEGLLQQPGVRRVTVLPIKDLEILETATERVSLVDMLQEYVDHPQWREWPFSNYLFEKFAGDLPVSEAVANRTRQLLARARAQVHGTLV